MAGRCKGTIFAFGSWWKAQPTGATAWLQVDKLHHDSQPKRNNKHHGCRIRLFASCQKIGSPGRAIARNPAAVAEHAAPHHPSRGGTRGTGVCLGHARPAQISNLPIVIAG